VLRVPGPVRVLAVRDLRLVRVQLKTHGLEPGGDSDPKLLGLVLSVAVDNDVVCVAFERAPRMLPGHPPVERVMHEHVSQQR